MTNNYLSVSIFSPGQLASIIIVSVLFVALVAAAIVFGYLIRKNRERKLYDLELQKSREALLAKLKLMREGNYDFGSEEEEEPEEEQPDAAEEVAIIVDEGDAVEEEVEETTGKVVRYNRSFTARITQASNDVKGYYSELKNYILSYAGVKGAVSWKHEVFRKGRTPVANFMVRGKTLCVGLPFDPQLFADTKYKIDDLSETNKSTKFPTLFRLKSDRRVSHAKQLIDLLMEDLGVKRADDYKNEDFTLPYKSTEVLIKNKLIKVIGGETDDYSDAAAAKKGISYNRSFTAKIIQANDALKVSYSELKNYMLSYNGVVAKSSWKREAYLGGKDCVATIVVRGKTLCLCLATDPEKFKKSKYKVENIAERSKSNAKTPCMYRVNGSRKMLFAKELVDMVFQEHGLTKQDDYKDVDYYVPYVSTNNLISKNMIRVAKSKPFKFRENDDDDKVAAPTPKVPAAKPATVEKPAETAKPQEPAAVKELPIEAENSVEEKSEASEKPAEEKPAKPAKSTKKPSKSAKSQKAEPAETEPVKAEEPKQAVEPVETENAQISEAAATDDAPNK